MANEIQASQMTEYLGRIYQMEKELYQIERVESWIKRWIKNCKNPKMKQHVEVPTKYRYNLLDFLIFGDAIGYYFGMTVIAAIFSCIVGGVCGGLFYEFFDGIRTGSLFAQRVGHGMIWGVVLFFLIHFIYVLIEDIKYTKEYKAERTHAEQQNIDIDSENNRNRTTLLQKAEVASKDLTKIINAKNAITSTLDRYYSINIIFPKYRNFVAISSLYEYFVTGRCRTLGVSDSGHEGAYNIYERELRENRIIAKLDQVISRLDQIIDNQQMLYSAIQECNLSINRIENNMKKSFDHLQKSSEIVAYNSSITRQNTEHLSWLESTRWVLNT